MQENATPAKVQNQMRALRKRSAFVDSSEQANRKRAYPLVGLALSWLYYSPATNASIGALMASASRQKPAMLFMIRTVFPPCNRRAAVL